jgi:hypothetical protein
MTCGDRTAAKPRYSLFELFVSSAIASAIFVAVLPSVSAARRLPHKHGRGTNALQSPDAIDAVIARLPTSWGGIATASVSVGTVVAGSVHIYRTIGRRRAKRCAVREAVAPLSQEVDNPDQPPSS